MARLVVIRGQAVDKTKPYFTAAGSLLTAIVAGVCFGFGFRKECSVNDEFCQDMRDTLIIGGSLFIACAGLSMIYAIALHFAIKRATENEAYQRRQSEQPFTVSPEYPAPPSVSSTTPTQYSTPHSTPTELSSPLPPPAYKKQPQIGFATDSQPYPPEITQSS